MEETKKIIDLSDRFFTMVSLLIIGLVVVGVLGTAFEFSNLPQNAPQQINVSGDGKAYAKPDIAMVSLGMHTQGFVSQQVINDNNGVMNAVIDAVKNLGIDQKDIQTTSYNVSPVYDYTDRGRVFKGYSLDQQISVKIRNFDKISDVLDKATSLGATTVGDLQFTIDNPELVRADARAKAIEAAKTKAVELASQSGLKLGKLINISEGGSYAPQPMYAQASMLDKASASIAPSIQSGQLEVNSSVTLTYLLK